MKSAGADTPFISFPRSPQSNILTKSFIGLYTWFKGLSEPREVIINGGWDDEDDDAAAADDAADGAADADAGDGADCG